MIMNRIFYKHSIYRLTLTIFAVCSITLLTSCEEEEDFPNVNAIEIPENFKVDVPASLTPGNSSGRIANTQEDAIEGGDLYEALRGYIQIADGSAEIVESLMLHIRAIRSNNLTAFDFISDDDGREKSVEIVENPTVGGITWTAGLVMKDKEADALALTVYWNPSPLSGVATFNVYQFDRNNGVSTQNTYYQIDYSENSTRYDQEMTVSISGIPLNTNDVWYVENMKMTVGKTGDITEVIGNSIHPTAPFFVDDACSEGLSYSFVARADESKDLAIASLGLPSACVNDNTDILKNYSLFAVLNTWFSNEFPNSTQELRDLVLEDAGSPAYFSKTEGFLGAGEANKPEEFTGDFVDIDNLSPFIPKTVADLSIIFPQ